MRTVEVCCSSLGEVREAVAGGARRVELCAAITCGGVTPSHATIKSMAMYAAMVTIMVAVVTALNLHEVLMPRYRPCL
jgi:copper homeostasis protein